MRQAKIKRFNTLDYTGTEAINTICTNLSFSGRNRKRIVITSYMQVIYVPEYPVQHGQTRQTRAAY